MKKLHDARLYAASLPGRKAHKGQGSPDGSPSRTRGSLPTITAMSKQRVEEELAVTERTIRQREVFFQKQQIREEEVRQRLEQSMKDTQKRTKERAIARDAEFEERCYTFCERNRVLIDEINEVMNEDENWKQRKRERLYAEWTAQVFNPMQAQIDEQLESMSHDDIVQKRRYMFQCFLDESNRKRGGVFRDIIIASDYDPLTMAKEATISYEKARDVEDPTKNRFTRERGDPTLKALKAMSANDMTATPSDTGVRAAGGGILGLGAPREASLPVRLWDHIEITPYGRYTHEKKRSPGSSVSPRRSAALHQSSVTMDHYRVPTGAEGSKLLAIEMQCRGKKVYEKPVTSIF